MELLNKVRQQPGCRGKLVIFYHNEEKLTPYQILVESVKKADLQLYLKRTGQTNGTLYEHSIQIDDETIVTDFAENNKNAREILGPRALALLEETCFSIVLKTPLKGQYVHRSDVEEMCVNEDRSHNYMPDNKGPRPPGWRGNNFDNFGSGWQEPFTPLDHGGGFGPNMRDPNMPLMLSKISKYLDMYSNNSCLYNLIFSNEFNNAERKFIHETAQKYKLKSKSFGQANKWQLVVSKKLGLWDLVELLLKDSNLSMNYELKRPTKITVQESEVQNLNPPDKQLKRNNNWDEQTNQKRMRPNVPHDFRPPYDMHYNQQPYNTPPPNFPSAYNSQYNDRGHNNFQYYNPPRNGFPNRGGPPDSYQSQNNYMQYHYSLNQHYNLQQQYNLVSKNKLRLKLSDVYLLNKVREQSGFRGKLILFHNTAGNLTPYQMLVESAQKAQLQVHLKRTGNGTEPFFEYEILIGDESIITGTAENNKTARDILGPKALKLLQENCFSVVVKTHLKGRQVDRSEIDGTRVDEDYDMDQYNESKGIRMMRQMGWRGQQLGRGDSFSDGGGVQKPVEVTENLRRFGLSFGKDKNLDSFQAKIMKYMEIYVKNPCTYNLVFSNQFTVDERKIIHETSLKLKLKSKSFGRAEGWQLVVSKKLSPWELVEHLLATGDSSPNYQLLRPTNMMLYNYFY